MTARAYEILDSNNFIINYRVTVMPAEAGILVIIGVTNANGYTNQPPINPKLNKDLPYKGATQE
jgi:hypothetical protein